MARRDCRPALESWRPKQQFKYCLRYFVAKNTVFSFFRTLLLSPSAPSPDRIYSPNYGFSRGDGVAPSPLAARRSTGSAAGRTSGFSSRLCRGFSPTQPAGGTSGPAAGQPVRRSGFHISPGSRRRGSTRQLHTRVNPIPVDHFCPNAC